MQDSLFLAVNLQNSPLKRRKKIILRHQREVVKIKISPLKTAHLSKVHRKIFTMILNGEFLYDLRFLAPNYFFAALIAFNAKNSNSCNLFTAFTANLTFLAVFSDDISTRGGKVPKDLCYLFFSLICFQRQRMIFKSLFCCVFFYKLVLLLNNSLQRCDLYRHL